MKAFLYKCFKRIELFLKRFYMTISFLMVSAFFYVMMFNPDARYGRYILMLLEDQQAQNTRIFEQLGNTVARLDTTIKTINAQHYVYRAHNEEAWKVFSENDKTFRSDLAKMYARQNFYAKMIVENKKNIDYLISISDSCSGKRPTPVAPLQSDAGTIIMREMEWRGGK